MLHNIAAEQYIIHKHLWISKLNTNVFSNTQITINISTPKYIV
jgi:hypothetical protein